MARCSSSNPWSLVWFHPQQAVRNVIDSRSRCCFLFLSWVYGFPWTLHFFQSASLGAQLPLGALLGCAVIVGALLGWAGLHVMSAVLYWTGHWIKGQGRYSEVRAAVVWSNAPHLISVTSWCLLAWRFGNRLFYAPFPSGPLSTGDHAIIVLLFLLQAAAGIWGCILLVRMLGEAHRFSSWKGLAALAMSFALFFVVATAATLLGSWLLRP
jgi:hypothetical protein